MSKIKVLDTLLAFEKKQLIQLEKFVGSPYFNSGYNAAELIELLGLLSKSSKKEPSKEQLQGHFYPDKPFVENSKNSIDNLLTDLNSLVEEFLVYETLKPQLEARSAWAKASYFSSIEREDRLWPIIVRYRKMWNKKKVIGFSDMIDRFELEELAAEYREIFKAQQKETGLAPIQYYLDKFYLAKKMKLGFFLVYEEVVLGGAKAGKKPDLFWEFVVTNYDQLKDLHTPLANLYYQAYRVASSLDDQKELDVFERLLAKNEQVLPQEDLRNLYVVYRSFRGRGYKLSGTKNLIPLYLKMYKEHLAKGVLAINGKLQASALKLLVNMGIKGEDYDWVREVLNAYPPKKIINTRFPQEFHRLCTAELFFAEKKYEEAESEMVYRLFEDFNYSLSCDILLVKIYFETQHDLLESRIRAMELKVRRAKLKDFDKQAYLAFISVIRKLDKYLWLKDEKKLAKIAAEIEAEGPLIQREWLLEWAEAKATFRN